ncbi:MAG: FAD-binding oxidoreductase [Gemmataceae bacterium]|nr:FAD-binding oxidoreductase [Gemmata sp.]MDW8198937.1 FAD-binding oxidoreductase [Gemmataceae bacterium]
MNPAITIDSFGPLEVQRPATVAELCSLVHTVRGERRGLYPVGGGTALDYGCPPLKPGIACDLTALHSIIDYPARDMTITVQAGITIAALQAELAKEGQWLPVDIPAPERSTLGGAVAVNACGPRRYGYGTLRDYVIGISFVTDDGVEVKAGGRVVKNVAGYDLMKLHIGALGTLGIVTQLTLKVKPKPEATAAVIFGCAATALAAILDALAATTTRPVAVEVLNPLAAQTIGLTTHAHDWTIVVGFEEKAAAVQWQVATLVEELRQLAIREVLTQPDTAILDRITAWQQPLDSQRLAKLSLRPSELAGWLTHNAPRGLLHAHGLNGIVWLHDPEPLPQEAILCRCPPTMKRERFVWGKLPASWDFMKHLKQTLDPDNVFNPGRLFGTL